MKPSSPALLIGFEGKPGAAHAGLGESTEEGSGALAGKAFKKALDGGDGQAIYDAFKAMQREADDEHADEEEPVAEAPEAA